MRAHFAYLFFDYALNGPFTVRDALDLAAEDTHGPEVPSFGDCQLYTGYEILDPRTNSTVIGKMRIWGDGEHLLPN
jgi:hypothetical protein